VNGWLLGMALAQSAPAAVEEAPAVPTASVGAEPVEAPQERVYVAVVDFPRPVLDRVVRQAERLGARIEPVAAGIRCLRFEGPPPADWVERAGRRLDQPLELRENCSVARYPKGEGWWVAVIGADPELEERIEASLGRLGMSVLSEPLDGRPASLCVPATQVPRAVLSERLAAAGLDVAGVWAVGSCTSRVHMLSLTP
jgi:hypothetical protein